MAFSGGLPRPPSAQSPPGGAHSAGLTHDHSRLFCSGPTQCGPAPLLGMGYTLYMYVIPGSQTRATTPTPTPRVGTCSYRSSTHSRDRLPLLAQDSLLTCSHSCIFTGGACRRTLICPGPLSVSHFLSCVHPREVHFFSR